MQILELKRHPVCQSENIFEPLPPNVDISLWFEDTLEIVHAGPNTSLSVPLSFSLPPPLSPPPPNDADTLST